MSEQFLHGVEVVELDYGARPISTVRSSVIGLIGTAPGAQPQTAASLGLGTLAANNALTFTSAVAGAIGNQTSVKLRNPQTNSATLSVSVNSAAIVVNLATDSGGLVTSTATSVIAAIAAKPEAAALVTVANTGASNGSGVVAARGSTLFLTRGSRSPSRCGLTAAASRRPGWELPARCLPRLTRSSTRRVRWWWWCASRRASMRPQPRATSSAAWMRRPGNTRASRSSSAPRASSKCSRRS